MAPSEEVGFVLQAAAVFTLLGTAVAARARRRNPDADAWLLTARWTLAGTALAIALATVLRVL